MVNHADNKPTQKNKWLSLSKDLLLNRLTKLLRWLLFGVVIGLLPFAFPFINIIASANTTPTWGTLFGMGTLNRLFGHADLFLVSATLAATAVGDLVASGKEKELRKVIAGSSCLAIFVVSVIWYGIISNKIEARLVYNINGTTKVSLGVFIGAVVTSAGCILLAEEVKEERRKEDERNI